MWPESRVREANEGDGDIAAQPGGPSESYIPLIDFASFLQASPIDTRAKQRTGKQIVTAFRNSGFIYLTNHGIGQDVLDRTYAHSRAFFARPLAEKDAVSWTLPKSNRGYTCMGREKVSNEMSEGAVKEIREMEGEDLKESFEIGRPDDPDPECKNVFPSDKAGQRFEAESLEFFALLKRLHAMFMRAVALGLDIPETWFDEFTDGGDNTLRLLHYPRVRKGVFQERKGQVRAGAHSDYGSITFLFQDDRGGLQVKGPHGEWVDAKPIPGTCVVNAADLLSRWSNDLIRSTLHRVVEPPLGVTEAAQHGESDGEYYPARYSIAYFCNPNFEKFIEVIPGTVEPGQTKKYEGINSGQYLIQRLTATY